MSKDRRPFLLVSAALLVVITGLGMAKVDGSPAATQVSTDTTCVAVMGTP